MICICACVCTYIRAGIHNHIGARVHNHIRARVYNHIRARVYNHIRAGIYNHIGAGVYNYIGARVYNHIGARVYNHLRAGVYNHLRAGVYNHIRAGVHNHIGVCVYNYLRTCVRIYTGVSIGLRSRRLSDIVNVSCNCISLGVCISFDICRIRVTVDYFVIIVCCFDIGNVCFNIRPPLFFSVCNLVLIRIIDFNGACGIIWLNNIIICVFLRPSS